MAVASGRIVAGGMLRVGTPVEDWRRHYGLWVKREDRACPPPGPPFSKTRGVYEHVRKLDAGVVGVLDTYHSQAGHAVARACQVLGKKCLNFYPVYKAEGSVDHHAVREPQLRSAALGASLLPLPAGRSCILYHEAKRITLAADGYMMPNALKLAESVEETAKEVDVRLFDLGVKYVLVPSSSGTIAAGVVRGYRDRIWADEQYMPTFLVHLGYHRSHEEVRAYLQDKSGTEVEPTIIDEGYAYKDVARPGPTPEWPCNAYYDLKAFRWWVREGRAVYGEALLWNIG